MLDFVQSGSEIVEKISWKKLKILKEGWHQIGIHVEQTNVNFIGFKH